MQRKANKVIFSTRFDAEAVYFQNTFDSVETKNFTVHCSSWTQYSTWPFSVFSFKDLEASTSLHCDILQVDLERIITGKNLNFLIFNCCESKGPLTRCGINIWSIENLRFANTQQGEQYCNCRDQNHVHVFNSTVSLKLVFSLSVFYYLPWIIHNLVKCF